MKFSSCIGLVVFLALLMPASVSAAPELKVGYVDLQKALAESISGKKAQKDYEQEVKEAQKDIDKKQKAYDAKRKAYEKQQASLNESAREEKEEELISLKRDLERSYKDSQESLRRKNVQMVKDLVAELRIVVDEIGKEDGFTVILEKNGQSVLYADSDIDVTQKVVSEFNARGR